MRNQGCLFPVFNLVHCMNEDFSSWDSASGIVAYMTAGFRTRQGVREEDWEILLWEVMKKRLIPHEYISLFLPDL